MHSLKSKVRTVPHWPKEGVMFRDVTTLLKDPVGFNEMITVLYERYKGAKIDVVAGIEARGFILGAALAHRLGVGFIPIRKKGKLPAKVIGEEYALEYGTDKIEVHEDAIQNGMNVLLTDDLIATAGTMTAAVKLIQKLHGNIVECCCIIDLPDLGGKKKLESLGLKVFTLMEFEGD